MRPRRPPPPREPKALLLSYSRAIAGILGGTSAKIHDALIVDPRFARLTEGVRSRLDDEVDELDDAIATVSFAFEREQSDAVIRDIVERHGADANAHNLKEFRRTFKASVALDLPGTAPHAPEILRSYARDNVRLIRTVNTQKIDRVRALVERSWRVGDRWETVSAKIQSELDKDPAIADRIARDQLQKLNSQLERDRQVAAGVRRWAWRTSKDGRVRAAHRNLEGKIYTWKEGHPTERFPGWPIHCRCYAEPVLEDEDGGFVGPSGDPFDAAPFPEDVGFASTSGGPFPRPSRTSPPPLPLIRRPRAPTPAQEPPSRTLFALAARTYRKAAREAQQAASGLTRGTTTHAEARSALTEAQGHLEESVGFGDDVVGDPAVSGALERLRVVVGRLQRGLEGRT